jgi:hypothetical protein
MRRNVASALIFVVAAAVVIGCQDSRFKHYYKAKEECVLPPPEGVDARFDKPPEAEYRARVKTKSDDKGATLLGSNKMTGGRPNGGF